MFVILHDIVCVCHRIYPPLQTLDVSSELDTVTVDFSSVDIYTTDLQNQLSDLKGAVNISFGDFYAEVCILFVDKV